MKSLDYTSEDPEITVVLKAIKDLAANMEARFKSQDERFDKIDRADIKWKQNLVKKVEDVEEVSKANATTLQAWIRMLKARCSRSK